MLLSKKDQAWRPNQTFKLATKQRSDVLQVKCPFNLFESVVNVCVSDNQATCIKLWTPFSPQHFGPLGLMLHGCYKDTKKRHLTRHHTFTSPAPLSLSRSLAPRFGSVLCTIKLLTCWCLCKKKIWSVNVQCRSTRFCSTLCENAHLQLTRY